MEINRNDALGTGKGWLQNSKCKERFNILIRKILKHIFNFECPKELKMCLMLITWNTLPDCQCFLELNTSLSVEARERRTSKLKKNKLTPILFCSPWSTQSFLGFCHTFKKVCRKEAILNHNVKIYTDDMNVEGSVQINQQDRGSHSSNLYEVIV